MPNKSKIEQDSPGMFGKNKQRDMQKKHMRRGQSNESDPKSQKILIPKMPNDNSDFTLSSLGNNL